MNIKNLSFFIPGGKYFKCFCRFVPRGTVKNDYPFEYPSVGKALAIVMLSLASTLLMSCEKPNPNPELSDPIYADLQKESESAAKDVESTSVEARKLEDDICKLEPRDPSRGVLINQRVGKEKAINGLKQRAEYFKIRAEQRLDFDRREYSVAFEKKKPWPDPEEYRKYQAIHKLQTVSRNWDDRVPKTTRYNKMAK